MLIEYLLPPGLRGVVVAGLLSALMGSLAGVFNACSTLFTVDLYQKWKPTATEHQMVRTGRIATAVMVLIALTWIPVIKGAEEGLYKYLQDVQSYLAPPIFVVSSSAYSPNASTRRAHSVPWCLASRWASSGCAWIRR